MAQPNPDENYDIGDRIESQEEVRPRRLRPSQNQQQIEAMRAQLGLTDDVDGTADGDAASTDDTPPDTSSESKTEEPPSKGQFSIRIDPSPQQPTQSTTDTGAPGGGASGGGLGVGMAAPQAPLVANPYARGNLMRAPQIKHGPQASLSAYSNAQRTDMGSMIFNAEFIRRVRDGQAPGGPSLPRKQISFTKHDDDKEEEKAAILVTRGGPDDDKEDDDDSSSEGDVPEHVEQQLAAAVESRRASVTIPPEQAAALFAAAKRDSRVRGSVDFAPGTDMGGTPHSRARSSFTGLPTFIDDMEPAALQRQLSTGDDGGPTGEVGSLRQMAIEMLRKASQLKRVDCYTPNVLFCDQATYAQIELSLRKFDNNYDTTKLTEQKLISWVENEIRTRDDWLMGQKKAEFKQYRTALREMKATEEDAPRKLAFKIEKRNVWGKRPWRDGDRKNRNIFEDEDDEWDESDTELPDPADAPPEMEERGDWAHKSQDTRASLAYITAQLAQIPTLEDADSDDSLALMDDEDSDNESSDTEEEEEEEEEEKKEQEEDDDDDEDTAGAPTTTEEKEATSEHIPQGSNGYIPALGDDTMGNGSAPPEPSVTPQPADVVTPDPTQNGGAPPLTVETTAVVKSLLDSPLPRIQSGESAPDFQFVDGLPETLELDDANVSQLDQTALLGHPVPDDDAMSSTSQDTTKLTGGGHLQALSVVINAGTEMDAFINELDNAPPDTPGSVIYSGAESDFEDFEDDISEVSILPEMELPMEQRIRMELSELGSADMWLATEMIDGFLWLGDDVDAQNIEQIDTLQIHYFLNCAANDCGTNLERDLKNRWLEGFNEREEKRKAELREKLYQHLDKYMKSIVMRRKAKLEAGLEQWKAERQTVINQYETLRNFYGSLTKQDLCHPEFQKQMEEKSKDFDGATKEQEIDVMSAIKGKHTDQISNIYAMTENYIIDGAKKKTRKQNDTALAKSYRKVGPEVTHLMKLMKNKVLDQAEVDNKHAVRAAEQLIQKKIDYFKTHFNTQLKKKEALITFLQAEFTEVEQIKAEELQRLEFSRIFPEMTDTEKVKKFCPFRFLNLYSYNWKHYDMVGLHLDDAVHFIDEARRKGERILVFCTHNTMSVWDIYSVIKRPEPKFNLPGGGPWYGTRGFFGATERQLRKYMDEIGVSGFDDQDKEPAMDDEEEEKPEIYNRLNIHLTPLRQVASSYESDSDDDMFLTAFIEAYPEPIVQDVMDGLDDEESLGDDDDGYGIPQKRGRARDSQDFDMQSRPTLETRRGNFSMWADQFGDVKELVVEADASQLRYRGMGARSSMTYGHRNAKSQYAIGGRHSVQHTQLFTRAQSSFVTQVSQNLVDMSTGHMAHWQDRLKLLEREQIKIRLSPNLTAAQREAKSKQMSDEIHELTEKMVRLHTHHRFDRRRSYIDWKSRMAQQVKDLLSRITVQCYDRSSCILLGYLVQNSTQTHQTSYYRMLCKKPNLLMNPGFRKQIIQYEKIWDLVQSNE